MTLKEVLKKANFTDLQIEILEKEETTLDQASEIITAWESDNNSAILEKKETKDYFKNLYVPNALAESRTKERKKINSLFSLGLTNSQIAEKTEDEWETLVKSSLTKTDDEEKNALKSKVQELTGSVQTLEDTLEQTKADAEKNYKGKLSKKEFSVALNRYLATLDGMVLDKEQLAEIIESKKITNGISEDLDENENLYLKDKDGNKMLSGNKAMDISEYFASITNPYKTKTPGAPIKPIEKGGEPIEIIKSANQIRLEAKLESIKN